MAEGIVDGLGARTLPVLTLRLGELGTFKRGRLVRVVWIGVAEGAADLRALAEAVEAETVAAGLEPESRPFAAHLTLARARHRDGAALPELPLPPSLEAWRAAELVLYRSRLGRAGSVYEPLRTLTLR